MNNSLQKCCIINFASFKERKASSFFWHYRGSLVASVDCSRHTYDLYVFTERVGASFANGGTIGEHYAFEVFEPDLRFCIGYGYSWSTRDKTSFLFKRSDTWQQEMMNISSQFLKFCVVGGIGFVTDSAVLMILTQILKMLPEPGRVVSFIVAATVTWALNRFYTFKVKHANIFFQWFRYLVITAIGGCINFGVYKTWLLLSNTAPVNLLTGVAAGSIVAMGFNYFVSRNFVFN